MQPPIAETLTGNPDADILSQEFAESVTNSTLRVVLPWPSGELSPNARVNHFALAAVKKRYRWACFAAATICGAKAFGQETKVGASLKVHLVFHKPSRRSMDEDGLISRMKAGLDGLADALQIDDRHFRLSHEVSPEVGGMVVVTVKEAA